jgi:hypothetical protein
MDGVSGTIATTQVEVQKSLAALSAKLVEQLQVLGNVEEAISLKREELKQLYNIESAAVSLDDLDAKIEAQRELWMEEQARKQREFAEQQAERNKQWSRIEEEYQYRMALEHKKGEDEFASRMAQQEKGQPRQAGNARKDLGSARGRTEETREGTGGFASAKSLDSASGRSAMEALQKVLEKDGTTYKSGK